MEALSYAIRVQGRGCLLYVGYMEALTICLRIRDTNLNLNIDGATNYIGPSSIRGNGDGDSFAVRLGCENNFSVFLRFILSFYFLTI